ncbi:MAG: hypothetical protein HS113_29835 [Verrucomicrobiales bacterium]|nr:hypothetical protein [Verrucomicrobiales bacterium]
MTTLKILFISCCCLLLGAAGLAAVMEGPSGVLAAPLVALFGWFFIVPIFLLVSLMWLIYGRWMLTTSRSVIFVLGGALIGAGVMFLVARSGMRGPEPDWLDGYLLGGSVAGGVACLMIAVLKRHIAEPDAAPNGGPATQLGNSGVTEGPPSVS